ncbi:hypothetical protein CBS101457_003899 [Exobasidium rhododendri]|nr:hypothetical protein CBS101457_003899 [Exobasidium rhododendri]
MATGERLTLKYAHPPSGALLVDLYCTVPPVNPIDPSSNLEPLPFFLFLHGGDFITGSRRDVPLWLVSLARSVGSPLLSADYRLAPHSGPSNAFEDLEKLWKFIRRDLPWEIACSGPGAEVESGTEPLDDDFNELKRKGGIDPNRGIIFGVGAGGYLASLGGGLLSPPPLALVLGYPRVEFSANLPEFSSLDTPSKYSNILHPSQIGNDAMAKSVVPDTPILLEVSTYGLNVREAAGMDMRELWRGRDESERRRGLAAYLFKEGKWEALLRKASPNMISPLEMLSNDERINRPYPPTIVYHGKEDSRIPYSSSEGFVESIRRSEPVAAAVDALSDTSLTKSTEQATVNDDVDESGHTSLKSVVPNPNITSRYLFLGIHGKGSEHNFDAFLPRTLSSGPYTKRGLKVLGARYSGGMMQVENFVRHWLAEGSTSTAETETPASRPPNVRGQHPPVGATDNVKVKGSRL